MAKTYEIHYHTTEDIRIGDEKVPVDAPMVPIIGWLNSHKMTTTACCENYGEYLRDLGINHIVWSNDNLGYIEFPDLGDAEWFIDIVSQNLPPVDPMQFKLSHQGTPGAWQLRKILEWGVWWVMFDHQDIPTIATILKTVD